MVLLLVGKLLNRIIKKRERNIFSDLFTVQFSIDFCIGKNDRGQATNTLMLIDDRLLTT